MIAWRNVFRFRVILWLGSSALIFWLIFLLLLPRSCVANVKERVNATFQEEGTRNRIVLHSDGRVLFVWQSLEDALCGVGRKECEFHYEILDDNGIYVNVPSSWVRYYSEIDLDRDGNIAWRRDGKTRVYKRIPGKS